MDIETTRRSDERSSESEKEIKVPLALSSKRAADFISMALRGWLKRHVSEQ